MSDEQIRSTIAGMANQIKTKKTGIMQGVSLEEKQLMQMLAEKQKVEGLNSDEIAYLNELKLRQALSS